MTTPSPGTDDEAQLGELAVRQGFVTADRLKQFLHQLAVERSRGARLSLGDLLIRCEILTPALLRRMLGVQGKAILYCPACALRFNILRHDPDRDYFCKQCKGKLEPTKTDDPTEYDWTSGDSSLRLPVITEPEILERQNRHFGVYAVAKRYLTADQLEIALALSSARGEPLGAYCVSKGLLHPGQVEEILAEQNKTVLLCHACGAVYTVRNYSHDRPYPCKKCSGTLETAVLDPRVGRGEDYPEP